MPDAKKARNTRVLVLVGLAAVSITIGLEALTAQGSPLSLAIRGMALMGYQFVFLSIVSSAYMVELVRFFGRPFIKVHHVLSVSGLAFITLHPLLVALRAGSMSVFLPAFDSLERFLMLGGRPAWYLIAIAVCAALLRQRIGGWRSVHFLNYVAFALATAHANLLGANFQSLAPRVVSWAMLAAVLAVFVHKRLRGRKPKRKPATS